MSEKIYVSKVVDEDGQIAILFSEGLLEALELKHEDRLVWHIGEDNTVSVTKHRMNEANT